MAKSPKKNAAAQQPTISAFFSHEPSSTKDHAKQRKRLSSPIDLTLEDNTPPKKKQRANGVFPNLSYSTAAEPSCLPEGGRAEQWRFEPVSPDKLHAEKKLPTAAEEAARKKNHEAFKRRLLGENSTFIQKKSREPSETAIDVDPEDQPAGDETDSDQDLDSAFTSFREVLSNKRRKGQALTAQKKKVEEVGPNGQTWTPLEKQVRDI